MLRPAGRLRAWPAAAGWPGEHRRNARAVGVPASGIERRAIRRPGNLGQIAIVDAAGVGAGQGREARRIEQVDRGAVVIADREALPVRGLKAMPKGRLPPGAATCFFKRKAGS